MSAWLLVLCELSSVFCRYVTYNSWLPHHTLSAVKILLAVTMYPTSHSQLISAFTSSPVHRMEIPHGFVDCLDADDDIVSVSSDFRTCDCILLYVYYFTNK